MKILIFISTALILLWIAFVGYIFTLPENITVEKTTVIEAPLIVCWNTIIDFENHSKWLKYTDVLYNYNNSNRQVRYNFQNQSVLMGNQQVRVLNNTNSIDFIPIGKERYSGLDSLSGKIELKSLPAGNTEILWRIRFKTTSLFQRFAAQKIILPRLTEILFLNTSAFKDFIENTR